MIPDKAIEAAAKYLALMMVDPDGNYITEATQLLEDVAPYMTSPHRSNQ